MMGAQARASVILWGNGERTLATAVGGPAHVVRGANLKQPIAIPRGRDIPCCALPAPGNEESQREAGFLNLVAVQLQNSCPKPTRLSHLGFLNRKVAPRLSLLPPHLPTTLDPQTQLGRISYGRVKSVDLDGHLARSSSTR